ncbi:unnamed protein product [Heterobilharzia americana]|nr:unnamed protein product [Heterobilharzia americana]
MSEVARNDETFLRNKMKLLEMTDSYELNLYQHLKNCIKHMLFQQRSDDFSNFEILSSHLKMESKRHGLGDKTNSNPAAFSMAKIQQKLFTKSAEEDEEPVADEDEEHPLPNIVENSFYFENAEVEFPEGEDVDEEEGTDSLNREITEAEDDEGLEEGKDVLPKSKWKPPIKVPREENHVGTNKKVYFVCHEPGLRWIKLPPVTPEQIVAARSIRRLFTGILDALVSCYPPFPGTEANYLRAQIARISASTQISPQNEEYEPLSINELADPSLEHWVHHTSYILPQGRVYWWNPKKGLDDDFDEFNDEEEGENEEDGGKSKNAVQPEHGPPILTPISSDLSIFGQKPWSINISSKLIPEYASVIVSSNLWIGAHAVSWGKRFENIYIGWGIKSVTSGFQPSYNRLK